MTPPRAKRVAVPAANRNARPAHNWAEIQSDGVRVLQVPQLQKIPWLLHGFSTRPGGSSPLGGQKVLNLGFTEWDTRARVLENRKKFLGTLGAADFQLLALKQIHSAVVHGLRAVSATPPIGDAAITSQPGLLLSAQTADCVPILLVDVKNRAVAAIHAGWRGTLQRIAAKTVGEMRKHFGTRAENVQAAIGPAIGGCCYEVGTDIAADFLSQFADAPQWFDEFRTGDEPNPIQWLNMMPPGHQPPPKNVLLDLHAANRVQLIASGVPASKIFVSDLCTACRRDLLFSYRKEGSSTGRMMAAIGIRPT